MTDLQIFEPEGRAIPYAIEGEGPVSLVLLPEGVWHPMLSASSGTISSRRPASTSCASASPMTP